jgi:phage terminase small subunit
MAKSRDKLKVKIFIEEMGLGRSPTAAARRAGYSSPFKSGKDLIAVEEIFEEVQAIQAVNRKNAEMGREQVMKCLLEAYQMAKTMDDPQSMIRAMGEVNRMCGHYAPERKEIQISTEASNMQAEIQALTKEELLRLVGDSEETPLLEAKPIDGEYVVEGGDEDQEV